VGARWSLVIGGLPTLICGIVALPALTRVDRRAKPPPSPPVADPSTQPVLTDVEVGE
jgi:hypothetical protein